jgi:hypothetical protein
VDIRFYIKLSKNLAMKNLIFLLFCIVAPLFLKAQYNEWLPIKAMSDSSFDNRNACLYGQYHMSILFWDKEMNATTTQICYRIVDESSIGNEQIAVYQPDVKLTNPKILDMDPYVNPSNFHLIYQTNEGNDIDLKSVIYQLDGTFSQANTVSSLPGDDVNATTNEYGVIAWENNGKIWVSQFLAQSSSYTNPFVIDSAGAKSPVFSANRLTYLKQDGDSTSIIGLVVNYNQGAWGISNMTTRSVAGMSSALTSEGTFFGNNLCLQNKIGLDPTGLILFDVWNPGFLYKNSPVYNYSQPAICDHAIGVKSMDYFLAYVSDSLSAKEIFVDGPEASPGINISQWPGEDIHPQFFVTFPSFNVISVNLFWESERQGFSTIYSTHYDYFFGATNEQEKDEAILVSPCPFNREATIYYRGTVEESVIRILDLHGKVVKLLSPQLIAEGRCKATWDGTGLKGNAVPSGGYIIVVYNRKTIQTSTVLKE